jgi:hypothetical protein
MAATLSTVMAAVITITLAALVATFKVASAVAVAVGAVL